MDNKYQEALDRVREDLRELAGATYYGSSDLATLQELVDNEKAFVIIKSKKISVWLLFESDSVEGYNAWTKGEKLTQEEFDYLREVLKEYERLD